MTQCTGFISNAFFLSICTCINYLCQCFTSLWPRHCRRCCCLHGAYVMEGQGRWKTEKMMEIKHHNLHLSTHRHNQKIILLCKFDSHWYLCKALLLCPDNMVGLFIFFYKLHYITWFLLLNTIFSVLSQLTANMSMSV